MATRTVSFQAKPKMVKHALDSVADESHPNQVQMAGGPDGVGRENNALAQVRPRDPNAVDEQFPTNDLRGDDPADVLMLDKLSLQDKGMPGVTPFGALVASDSDFEWLRRKREEEAEANFQQWFASNFDKMSPNEKKIARDLFPGFYAQRMRQLAASVDLQKRIAQLKIMGIQSKDDLLLQYAMEAGYIESSPLENILHPERAADAQKLAERQARYSRGLLNPRRNRMHVGTQLRADNAMALTGRKMEVGDAFSLGTVGHGFSAIGSVDGTTERNLNTKQQMGDLEQFFL